MPEPQKRQTAYKIRIKDLANGRYVKEEGWTPNYIVLNDGREVSRINLIAAVLTKESDPGANYQSIILDDGTGKISARLFEKNIMFENIKVGDPVIVIGRPREYGSEVYILPEIIKRIDDPRWIKVRMLELNKIDSVGKAQRVGQAEEINSESVEEKVMGVVEEKSPAEKVIDFIRSNDGGAGVDVGDILKSEKSAENLVELLLKEGEIFEVRPGRFKVLE